MENKYLFEIFNRFCNNAKFLCGLVSLNHNVGITLMKIDTPCKLVSIFRKGELYTLDYGIGKDVNLAVQSAEEKQSRTELDEEKLDLFLDAFFAEA